MKRTRAILVPFHQYTPFGEEFYQIIFNFFVKLMLRYLKEYDKLYIINSNWNIDKDKLKYLNAEVINVNPSLRYYDAYKKVLPQIKEDSVLFLDNDTVIYNRRVIDTVYDKLDLGYDVVSIIDDIGKYKTNKLDNGNKFCPYFFATKKDLLMNYLDVDWSPDMPYCETLGHLTEAMLKDDLKVFEYPEDKMSIYFSGRKDGTKGLNTGVYHVRAGSTPAYLLATREYGDKKVYRDYLANQPRDEYLRQIAWYWIMSKDAEYYIIRVLRDCGVQPDKWTKYMQDFRIYHAI